MLQTEMEFSNDTLYVFMKGSASRRGIYDLQRKVYRIIDDYDIKDIVINIKGVRSMDGDSFYQFLDDYDMKYGGKLDVIE